MESHKRKLQSRWETLRVQYPQLISLFNCSESGIPTLGQINNLLLCFQSKIEGDFDSACDRLLALLEQQDIIRVRTDQVCKPHCNVQGPDYINSMPNEVLSLIFKYVILTSSPEKVKSYYLISKTLGMIARDTYLQLRKQLAYTNKGFPVEKGLKPIKRLLDYFPKGIIRDVESLNEWTESESTDVGLVELCFGRDNPDDAVALNRFNRIDIPNEYEGMRLYAYFNRSSNYPDWDCDITKDRIVWNHDKMVIKYPIGLSNAFGIVMFYRLYKSRKGYFTIMDIVERVNEFYQTGLTMSEYDCLVKGIIENGLWIFKTIPTLEQMIDQLLGQISGSESKLQSILHTMVHNLSVLDNIEDQLIYYFISVGTINREPKEVLSLIKSGKMTKLELGRDKMVGSIQFKLWEGDIVCVVDTR